MKIPEFHKVLLNRLRKQPALRVYLDDVYRTYGFGEDHPFSLRRYDAFEQIYLSSEWHSRCQHQTAYRLDPDFLRLFHDMELIEFVKQRSDMGEGYLDGGDTPAISGIYEAALYSVGSVLNAAESIMNKDCRRAFVPIAGLHHSYRDRVSGFCVFNDMAIASEVLFRDFGLKRIAYVDIDAHHGDGVFYGYEHDPRVIFADIHQLESGFFPGTGHEYEVGKGSAKGTKLNIGLPSGAGDGEFFQAWETLEKFVMSHAPEFIFVQVGADGLKGDPLASLRYSEMAHHHAASRLRSMADELGHGRLLAMGGGGYHLKNIQDAWMSVIQAWV